MDWSFGDVIWSMVVFFFWVMYIWIFITIFADVLRRNDIGGWAKAGWFALIFIVPFIGALIYLIARPKMTEQDKQMAEEYSEAQRRVAGYSAADEIAKAQELKAAGAISDEEFENLKRKALM